MLASEQIAKGKHVHAPVLFYLYKGRMGLYIQALMQRLLLLLLFPLLSQALPVLDASLSFDGLATGEQVLSYYAGGFGNLGSGPGPQYGVSFTSGLAADSTSIAFGPSAVLTAPSVTMSLDSTFVGTLSFYFTGNANLTLYSGPNATGALLLSTALQYPPFFPFATAGAFQSVVFTPAVNNVLRLDSVTLSSQNFAVIPEPNPAALFGIAILSTIVYRRPKR